MKNLIYMGSFNDVDVYQSIETRRFSIELGNCDMMQIGSAEFETFADTMVYIKSLFDEKLNFKFDPELK